MAGIPGWEKAYEHSPGDIEDGVVAEWHGPRGFVVNVMKYYNGEPYYDERREEMVYPTEYWVSAGNDNGGAAGPELSHVKGVCGSFRKARAEAVAMQRAVNSEGLDGSDLEV